MSNPTRGFGYVRVSTARQAQAGHYSIIEQCMQIIRFAEQHSVDLGNPHPCIDEEGNEFESRERIIFDAGESAYRKTFKRREGGRWLWNNLKSGDTLIIPKINRTFRNTRDCLECCHHWLDNGVDVSFIDLGMKFDTVMGRVIITLLAALAEMESGMKSERMKESHAIRKQMGKARYDVPQFGFRFQGEPPHRALVPCTRSLATMKLIWLMHRKCKMSNIDIRLALARLKVHRQTVDHIPLPRRERLIEFGEPTIWRSVNRYPAFAKMQEDAGQMDYDREAGERWLLKQLEKGEWRRRCPRMAAAVAELRQGISASSGNHASSSSAE